jgi:hypothetical protein
MNCAVPREPVPAHPVLTPVGLQHLTDDVGPESARAFLVRYLRLLPSRADRIVEHLACSDVGGARKAISSLQVTSSMAGALKLESYCQLLDGQLSLGRIPNADTARAALDENISLLRPAFAQLLSPPARTAPGS